MGSDNVGVKAGDQTGGLIKPRTLKIYITHFELGDDPIKCRRNVFLSLYGCFRLFGLAIASASFLNLLIPGACECGVGVVMLVQILQGLCQVRSATRLLMYYKIICRKIW